MLRVRMKTHITGYRDGQEWPQRGGEIDLPDDEAHDLEANGYAEIVGEPTSDPVDDGLDELGIRKLRALARDAGIEFGKDTGKDDLVAALRAQKGDPDAGEDGPPAGDTGGQAPGADGSDGAPADEDAETGDRPVDEPTDDA